MLNAASSARVESAHASVDPPPSSRGTPVPEVLMCTDLAGFTSTVERLGDTSAQALLHIHNRLLRAGLRECRGREVTHTGDGILASFRSVDDAIEGATCIQRSLATHNRLHADAVLKVRIGLHVGAPLPEEGRLFGACVNFTVRICSAARPESIFVSDDFRRLAQGQAVRFLELGAFALKGFVAPARLHELSWR